MYLYLLSDTNIRSIIRDSARLLNVAKLRKKKEKKNLGREGKSGGRVFNNKFLNIRERETFIIYGGGWGRNLLGTRLFVESTVNML